MIALNDILSNISQEEIMQYYFGNTISLHNHYVNPFRKDNRPGCYFYYNSNNKLIFRDSSYPEFSGDCFFICALTNNLDTKQSFLYDVLKIINKDFDLNLMPTSFNSVNLVKREIKKLPSVINHVKKHKIIIKNELYSNWKDYHIDFWKQYDITLETLKKYEVYPIKYSFIGKKIWDGKFKTDPLFEYPINEIRTEFQIYRPNAYKKQDKFRTNATGSPLMGLKQLGIHNDTIFITSSYKDVMVLSELGINAVCPIGEHTKITDKNIEYLKFISNNIVINYDNDASGKQATKKLLNLYPEFDKFFVPLYKDISDYIKNEGYDKAKLLVNKYGK